MTSVPESTTPVPESTTPVPESPPSLSDSSMQPFEILETPNIKKVKLKLDKTMDTKLNRLRNKFVFGTCIVDFHHVRGPEIEYWIDDTTTEDNEMLKIQHFTKVWAQLPFQALPDGAHLFEETFSNFTLIYDDIEDGCPKLPIDKEDDIELVDGEVKAAEIGEPNKGLTTLFGCACIRQLDMDRLKQEGKTLHRAVGQEEFTRSVIQKSVVVITRYPITIQLKEQLSIITKSYFDQLNFADKGIIKALYDNVSLVYNSHGYRIEDDDLYEGVNDNPSGSTKIIRESDFYIGLNLKELVTKLGRKLLMVYKALLLEQRVLIFCKDLNTLSNIQYSLLSLIPNLLMNLSDCGSPLLDKLSYKLQTPTSLKSSDRGSMLRFVGMPLKLFDKGGFFQPFITLQQLDYLVNKNTQWFLVGTSNDILLERKKEWFDMILYINENDSSFPTEAASAMDFIFKDPEVKLEILSKDLKDWITLTSQDKQFIDYVMNEVSKGQKTTKKETRVEPASSKMLNSNALDIGSYNGGDDFIRYQFEDYLIGMLSTIKYDQFLSANKDNLQTLSYLNLNQFEDQVTEFNSRFIDRYMQTQNFKLFEKYTEDELFNFFEPCHVGTVLIRRARENASSSAKARLRGLFSGWKKVEVTREKK
ncbi:hypothetical protein FOA43_002279 [Brettanomyces nanus]|uniref:UDENN domain-containing protein n=1 Tax=Eeniella nana TaxID=13502 RepID=A0A875RZI0_EENNA|nr:uncharacterized protein FOA43_002279 [Brettanomyces nanus]QPG74941.1 hypothetical protein FOA43_002279 [Brettanomyces nanus]